MCMIVACVNPLFPGVNGSSHLLPEGRLVAIARAGAMCEDSGRCHRRIMAFLALFHTPTHAHTKPEPHVNKHAYLLSLVSRRHQGTVLPFLCWLWKGSTALDFFFAEIIHSLLWCTLAAQHSLLQYYETRWWLTYSIFPIDNSSTLPVKVILQRNCRSPVQSKSFSKLNNVIMVASLFRHPLPSAGRICCRCVFMHEVQH